jgi:hypothetical protein
MHLYNRTRTTPGIRFHLATENVVNLPENVAGPLRRMGRACNDIGLTLASALLEQGRALDRHRQASQDPSEGPDIESDTAEAIFDATVAYIHNLTDVYTATVAPYAVYAVETASRAINEQPLTPPSTGDIVAADLFLLAPIHLPLIQLDPQALPTDRWRHRVGLQNEGLAESHRLLGEAIAEINRSGTVRDERGLVESLGQEPEFPSLLHEYASDCIVALTLTVETFNS